MQRQTGGWHGWMNKHRVNVCLFTESKSQREREGTTFK